MDDLCELSSLNVGEIIISKEDQFILVCDGSNHYQVWGGGKRNKVCICDSASWKLFDILTLVFWGLSFILNFIFSLLMIMNIKDKFIPISLGSGILLVCGINLVFVLIGGFLIDYKFNNKKAHDKDNL